MKSQSTAERLRFLKAWASDPGHVGAVAPSSRGLAQLITSEIDARSTPVLELGPGTGIFTAAILARGVDERDLTLVEREPAFAKELRRRFPGVRVLEADATRLFRLRGQIEAGAVVSGLPLLNMGLGGIMRVVAGAFELLRPDGAFYQFTYGPRCPVPETVLDRLGLEAKRIGRVVRNLPPATVYRIRRVGG